MKNAGLRIATLHFFSFYIGYPICLYLAMRSLRVMESFLVELSFDILMKY